MNRKNNFLITISENNRMADNVQNTELPHRYNFKAGIVHVSINHSDDSVFAASKDDSIIILLSGYIYQDDVKDGESINDYLLSNYSKYKKDFVKYLNGSFCIFFADKNTNEIYFATDRINNRKLFKFANGRKLIFSTDIKDLPLKDCKLSYAGMASYLLNGALLNDLTLFDEIQKLERASLHKIENFNIISEKYWDYIFTNEYANRVESDLIEELHDIYIRSLRRKVKDKKNIFISLSGGYDSRGIAVMLKDILKDNSKVTCFSYNFGSGNKDTDSDIANQITQNLDYPFILLNSYKGNIFSTIKNNSEFGQGLAYFSIEWDAWEEINRIFLESDNSILLTGDMHEGGRISIQFHGNLRRALEKVTIFGPEFLKEFREFIKPEIVKQLGNSWEPEYNKIYNKASEYENIVNLIDYLYLDQRIPNVMCTARECFQMPFIETATPYYDNEVLDFYRKLPPALRDNMTLHKAAIRKKYPGIFRIKIATGRWGEQPDWTREVHSRSKDFIDDIQKNSSMMDTVIEPKSIICAINGLGSSVNKNDNKKHLRSFHDSLNRLLPSYHKFIEILPGGKELTRIAGKYVNTRITYKLHKILIQRSFLSSIKKSAN